MLDDRQTGAYTAGHVERRAFALTLAILVALDLLLSALFVWHERSLVAGIGMFVLAGGPLTIFFWPRMYRSIHSALQR
jgi:hypothetical protein